MIIIDNISDVEKFVDYVDVITFDLDDTLYSEKDYVKSGFEAIAHKYPYIQDFEKKLWDAFIEGKKAIDFVLNQENMDYEKERCLDIYRRHKPKISLYPNVFNMLQRIKKIKKTAMITDGRPEGQWAKIDALGLKPLMDQIIVTDELGGAIFRKPNEKAFILLREYFNCKYEKMVYVGDNINKDFVAPEKLGMECIYFKNKEGLYNA